MKGFILYRILTILVNMICTILGMSLLVVLTIVLSQPQALLSFLVALAVILYAVQANRFLLKVLIKQEMSTRKHRDWLQVNAIVTVIFSLLLVFNALMIINNPSQIVEMLKELPYQYPASFFVKAAIAMLVVAAILLAHVSWTYILVRRHKEFFEEEGL